MGTMYREKRERFRLVQSQVTSVPVLRFLAPGTGAQDIKAGELVGIKPDASMQVVAEKITAANQYAQAKNALMRVDTTLNDTLESGAITCQEGLYLVRTENYVAGSYAVGDDVTLRYDATFGGGVFGPVDGSTTHIIGQVVVAPQNGTDQTPMVIKVFPVAQKK